MKRQPRGGRGSGGERMGGTLVLMILIALVVGSCTGGVMGHYATHGTLPFDTAAPLPRVGDE